MKASTFCQPALTCDKTQGRYIEGITQLREDMNIRVVKTIFYEQLMLPPCNVLFIIWSEVGTRQKLKLNGAKSSWGKTHAFSMCCIFFDSEIWKIQVFSF